MVQHHLHHVDLQPGPVDIGRSGDRDEVATEEYALDIAGREQGRSERRSGGARCLGEVAAARFHHRHARKELAG